MQIMKDQKFIVILCFFIFYLYTSISVRSLKKEEFASFDIEGDFSGEVIWILKTENALSESTLHLHLQTHHFLLKFISILPFSKKILQYSDKLVTLEGKK